MPTTPRSSSDGDVIQLEQCKLCSEYVDTLTMQTVGAPNAAKPARMCEGCAGVRPGKPDMPAARRFAEQLGQKKVAKGVRVGDVADVAHSIAETAASLPLPPKAQGVARMATQVLGGVKRLFGKK